MNIKPSEDMCQDRYQQVHLPFPWVKKDGDRQMIWQVKNLLRQTQEEAVRINKQIELMTFWGSFHSLFLSISPNRIQALI